jgi:hypothetical protein
VDILRNLLDAADVPAAAAARALQAHSADVQNVLQKLLVISSRVLADSLPNEAAVVLTSGLAALTGAAACVPTAGNTIAMQSQVLQCSSGLTHTGSDAIGTSDVVVKACNDDESAFFGAGASSGTITVRSPSVTFNVASDAALCGSPLSMQLLALTRPLSPSTSAAGSITAAYLGLAAAADLTIAGAGATFAGPTVHVAATAGGALVTLPTDASVRIVLPVTVNPGVPAAAVLLLPAQNGSVAAGRAMAASSMDAGVATANYTVMCPTESAAYVDDAAVVTTNCSATAYTVTCSAAQAGGSFSGQCPVSAFTAACMSFDQGSGTWSPNSCAVVDVSNEYVTCDCSSTGAFAPSFATVNRPASSTFAPAAAAEEGSKGAPGDESGGFGAGPIVAVVLVGLVLVLVVALVMTSSRRRAARKAKVAERRARLETGNDAQVKSGGMDTYRGAGAPSQT